MTSIMAGALCVSLLAAGLAFPQGAAAQDPSHLSNANGPSASDEGASTRPAPETQSLTEQSPRRADFSGEPASNDARQVADWVVTSGDNRGLPFVIVDKVNAKVFVFDNQGRLRGATRALLGLARGDDSVAGIGDRKLSSIRPEERTTPAGRFVAALGRDSGGQDILWVDYATAISLHRVITSNPKERRLQRLATASLLDKRISYGCINVPKKFYESVIISAFTGTNGIVYILPETKSIREVFFTHNGEEPTRSQFASQPAPAP
jgi:hypothetical protein